MSRPFVIDHAPVPVGEPLNAGTSIFVPNPSRAPAAFESVFARHYDAFRAQCEAHHEPGLALLLAGPGGELAGGWLRARPGKIATATVGRHSAADLVLPGDETLSLRQLMVIVEPPRQSWSDLRFRLLDLRAPSGMVDERGRRLGALQSEGPCFVRCGRSVLFCLPTGDGVGWPDGAADGWACIPERVYFDDEPAYFTPRPELRQPPVALRPAPSTTIRTHPGPREVGGQLLAPIDGQTDERAVGRLSVSGADGRETVFLVGPAALQRGILLGRYRRCDVSRDDTAAGGGITARAISRVHLLILRIGERLFAIDTGSTFGVQHSGRYVQRTELDDGTALQLAGDAATVVWRRNGSR